MKNNNNNVYRKLLLDIKVSHVPLLNNLNFFQKRTHKILNIIDLTKRLHYIRMISQYIRLLE